jgi:hypothetical protein
MKPAFVMMMSVVAAGCATDLTCPPNSRVQNGLCYATVFGADSGPVDAAGTSDGAVAGACSEADSEYTRTSTTLPMDGVNCYTQTLGGAPVQAKASYVTCLQGASENMLSGSCAACLYDYTDCGFKNCLGQCTASVDSPECVQCQCASGCIQGLASCSGIPQSTSCP